MEINTKIALLGATGKAGKYLLNQLLEKGYRVKALIRNPGSYTISHPLLEIISGDIKDFDAAQLLLADCNAVISTIGQVKGETLIASLATANILQAMNKLNIKRYLLLTGLNIDIPGDQKSLHNQAGSAWMKKTFPVEVADKQKVYDVLACSSEIDWTLFRLPWIEQTDERRGVKVNLQDCLGEKISTTDLADFLISQLTDKEYIKKAPFVASL